MRGHLSNRQRLDALMDALMDCDGGAQSICITGMTKADWSAVRTDRGVIDRALWMLCEGKSLSEVAQTLGVSRSSIKRWVAISGEDLV